MEKKFINPKDILILLGMFTLAIVLWTWLSKAWDVESELGPYAEIYFYGEVVDTVYLNGEDETFSIPEAPQITFERKNNAIAFVHSNCPDQVCVHTGWLNKSGHFAACLPNGVTLWITDDAEDAVDIVAG